MILLDKVTARFLRYVKYDTQSDPESTSCPSSQGQLIFAQALARELAEIGLSDVSLDGNGYVMATLPANSKRKVKTVGFIAHMDTSPDAPGKNVNPAIIESYAGGDIPLNPGKQMFLSPKDYPALSSYVGETLIVTDGTTLLGADNKAGVAAIVTAMERLIAQPELEHGPVKIAFTPDEEIGRGADLFDVEKFNADFAYTVDGGPVGELEYENFNAAGATIKINGTSVHPGAAKSIMVSSLLVAMELQSLLPVGQRPEFTENYEGFYHLVEMRGNVDRTRLQYIIRDHSAELFKQKKEFLRAAVAFLNSKYGPGTVELEIVDSYFNMKEIIEPVMEIIDLARSAMEALGIEPKISPIRGGTDGARLSFMGLPCPNIFTGGHNFHGRYEYIPVKSMEKAVATIIKIIELNSK